MSDSSLQPPRPSVSFVTALFSWSMQLLSTTVWLSTLTFGLYILLFYGLSWLAGELTLWNSGVLQTYAPDSPAANNAMAVHFLGGGILLVLGNIQLLPVVRQRFPVFHRWTGRLYASMAVLAALGGLLHIAIDGTIGGVLMNIGFSLYGLLMLVAAVETVRHARARRLATHRLWALRLYALAVASWLYRIEYGIWFVLTGGIGIDNFQGPFDKVMVFFFYLPNLLLVEWLVRAQNNPQSSGLKLVSSLAFLICSLFVIYVAYLLWLPYILNTFG